MVRSRLAARFAPLEGGRTYGQRLARLFLALAPLAACGSGQGEAARPDEAEPQAPPAATRADVRAPAAGARRTGSGATAPVLASAPEAHAEVALEPVELTGVVLGPDGRGVPSVEFRVRRRGSTPVEICTDAGGRFVHQLAVPGGSWLRLDERTLPEGLLARRDGRALPLGAELLLQAPPSESTVIELVEAAALEGSLALPDGSEVAHGQVELEPLDEVGLSAEADVGPDGRFLFEHLHPGSYRLQVEWWVPQDRAAPLPYELALEPGHRATVELVLGAGPCTLDGRVLGSDGSGYTGGAVEVLVEVGPGRVTRVASSRVDEHGRFTVEGLAPGQVLVRMPRCPGTGFEEVPAPLVLDLEPGVVARLADLQLDCTAADLAEYLEMMLQGY